MRELDQTSENHNLRMRQLEGELHRLIAAVDARLSAAKTDRRSPVKPKDDMPLLDRIKTLDSHHIAAFAGLAAFLFAAGWGGSSLCYSNWLKAQVEDELRPYASELADTVTTIQTDLAPRLIAADELKVEIDRARRDLIGRDEEVGTTITEAQSQLLAIRDTAIDDIERRLSDQTDDLSSMLESFRKRAIVIDEELDQAKQALSAFDHQMPVLTEGFGKVATGLVEHRETLAKISEDVAILDKDASPLLETINDHRMALDNGGKSLNILKAQLEALKSQTARSGHQLDQVLEEGRTRINDWQGVDRDIEIRKESILRNLDHYADSLNTRVREFIDALNVETASSTGS